MMCCYCNRPIETWDCAWAVPNTKEDMEQSKGGPPLRRYQHAFCFERLREAVNRAMDLLPEGEIRDELIAATIDWRDRR
jgi:hypothetical protein